MTQAPFQDRPPHTDRLNAYDEQHLAIYLRLLMADEEGADWREVVQVIFGINPSRAKTVHDSHLALSRERIASSMTNMSTPQGSPR
jgi:hypothetical protein